MGRTDTEEYQSWEDGFVRGHENMIEEIDKLIRYLKRNRDIINGIDVIIFDRFVKRWENKKKEILGGL